jgi:hypothetical protein
VWQFLVNIIDERVKHSFSVQTNTAWRDFVDMAHQHIDKPRSDVRLGYRISGDTRAMSYLASEYDWDMLLRHVRERVVVARTRAVMVDVKNMVSNWLF